MDIELLVVLDPADCVLVHRNPLAIAVAVLRDFIPLLIVCLITEVVLVEVLTLLDVDPVLLVL